jgi:phosphohistidine phosphatase
MDLLVVRHAIAEDRETFAQSGRDDGERPLTNAGRKKMVQGVQGLTRVVPQLDVLASSPLVRARQTAEIVAEAYGGIAIEEVEALASGADAATVTAWLRDTGASGTVAVVGHEPDLSGLVCYLLAGADDAFVELKKGAACLVTFAGEPRAGGGELKWSLAPKHLRLLGGAGA